MKQTNDDAPPPPSGGGSYEVCEYFLNTVSVSNFQVCPPDPDPCYLISFGYTYITVECETVAINGSSDPDDCPSDEAEIPIIPEEDKPCPETEALENDVLFKTKMAEIRANLSNSQKLAKETGYTFNGANNPTYFESAGNSSEIKLNIEGKIDGYIHSHYDNGQNFPSFSPGDVLSMSLLLDSGNIRNSEEFFMGLTSFTGDNFLLKISDAVKFETFADTWLSNQTVIESREGLFMDTYLEEDKTKSTVDAGEIALLQFINGSGLKLYKSNSSMSKWQPRTLGIGGFPKNGNCN